MSGQFDEAKGKVKQAAGDLTDNDDLKNEGKADELGGKAKQALEDVKDKAEDVVDAIKDKFNKN